MSSRGENEAALRVIDEMLDLANSIQDKPAEQEHIRYLASGVLAQVGELDRAIQLHAHRTGFDRCYMLLMLAGHFQQCEKWDQWRDLLRRIEAEADAEDLSPKDTIHVYSCLAMDQASTGMMDEAQHNLKKVARTVELNDTDRTMQFSLRDTLRMVDWYRERVARDGLVGKLFAPIKAHDPSWRERALKVAHESTRGPTYASFAEYKLARQYANPIA